MDPLSIDDLFQNTPIGSLDKAVSNNLFGIDHLQAPSAVPSNQDQQGFVFFVRPQLNLQDDNVKNDRRLYSLLSTDPYSMHRAVRVLLDPRLMEGYRFGWNASTNKPKINIPPIECPLVDNEMPFFAILTNNLLTMSGWPDLVVPTYTSAEGRFGESFTIVDGVMLNYKKGSLTATFRNTISDPILYLFYIWELYTTRVFSGQLVPYPDFISNNRVDYNSRVFRVILDKTRQKVTKIMATGPAITVSVPVGTFGDYNVKEGFITQNREFSIQFDYTAMEVFDPILVYEFNRTVEMFKRSMRAPTRQQTMTLLPLSLHALFKNRAYPFIDPDTFAMQWWVDNSLFEERTRRLIAGYEETQNVSVINGDPVPEIFEEPFNPENGAL